MLLQPEPIFRRPEFVYESAPISRSTLSDRIDWGLKAHGIPDLWVESRGKGVLIGIIDTGLARHVDLPRHEFAVNCSRSRSVEDQDGHSFHVAGIIAARENGGGVVGVAPEASIGYCKGLGDDGSGTVAGLVKAIRRCVSEGCNVINMSWGGGFSQAIADEIAIAAEAGVLCIAAAGNSGHAGVDAPGRLTTTLAVGSYNQAGKISRYSARGPEVDVVAPGEKITSCWLGNSYRSISGTSMACPFVAGIAALAKAAGQTVTLEDLRGATVDRGQVGKDPDWGWGLVSPADLFDEEDNGELGPYDVDVRYIDNQLRITVGATNGNGRTDRPGD